MTTFEQFQTCSTLVSQLREHDLFLRWGRDGQVLISVDSTKHHKFVSDNIVYRPRTVEEALAWIDGFTSDTFRKNMEERKK